MRQRPLSGCKTVKLKCRSIYFSYLAAFSGVKGQRPLWGVQGQGGANPLGGGFGGGAPEAKEKHHLIALKIRLEAHILVL